MVNSEPWILRVVVIILYVIAAIFFVVAVIVGILWATERSFWFLDQSKLDRWVVVIPIVASAFAFFAGMFLTRIDSQQKKSDVTLSEKQAQRNRQTMLELVKNIWVEGFLKSSLHKEVLIRLGLEERKEAVERPWDMVLQTEDQPNRPLPPGTEIIDVFHETARSLLILGEPGSGKTTLLLELARDSISRAEQDPTQRIPVVFNLSSWNKERPSLDDWLVDELRGKYFIPKKIAQHWVEHEELLLLLDGLDEVAKERRSSCVHAINSFRQQHLAPLVICSRIADYESLKTKLKLQGAVLLQPLTREQIDQYLDVTGPDLEALRLILENDGPLQELAQTPLMLSIMTLAYQKKSVEELSIPGSKERRREHLFNTYIQKMLTHRSRDRRYSLEQTLHWLKWVAQRMVQNTQTIFLIEKIQPDWLQTTVQKNKYRIFVRLITGLLYGLIGGLFTGLFLGSVGGLSFGLIGGLLNGLILGVIIMRVRWWGLEEIVVLRSWNSHGRDI